MLIIKELTKTYDEIILDNISFHFHSNKIYGLIGINGSRQNHFIKKYIQFRY